MARTREIACIFYQCEGTCLKGGKGTFRKGCQTCRKYAPRKGGVPARKNLKREKYQKMADRDMRQMMKSY